MPGNTAAAKGPALIWLVGIVCKGEGFWDKIGARMWKKIVAALPFTCL